MSQVETDSLVIRITTEVLKGVEASFSKKIDPVLMRLEACSSKLAAFVHNVNFANALLRICWGF